MTPADHYETVDATGRRVRTFCVPPRITSLLGSGVMVYAKQDGWAGVRLDGETRIDEYPIEHLALAPALCTA